MHRDKNSLIDKAEAESASKAKYGIHSPLPVEVLTEHLPQMFSPFQKTGLYYA